MHRRGFTLIELLVVISIISLLSSIVLTSVNSARAKARDARRVSDLRQISLALELYYDTNGSYPAEGCAGGQWALNRTDGIACWNDLQTKLAPYISRLPVDPLNTYPPTDSGNHTYHYNSVNWNNGSVNVSWAGGANQGYMLIAYPETSSLKVGDCWPAWYGLCVK